MVGAHFDLAELAEYRSGRDSNPEGHTLNIQSLLKSDHNVLVQHQQGLSRQPHRLVMAYERDEQVTPVVADLDILWIGVQSMEMMEAMPENQCKLMRWCLRAAKVLL